MDNHERALKTYEELQRRKAAKKKAKSDAQAFRQDTFYKCLNLRHELKIYR